MPAMNTRMGMSRRNGASIPPIITQTVAPSFGPYVAGDTPADAYSAGTYASTAGTISSAVAQWTINGVSQPGSTVLVEGDVVGLTVLVTDSAANTRTFGYGTTFVSSSGDTTPPEMTSFSYTAPMAAANVNEPGKVWYLVNTSATLLSGVSLKALVQAMTPVIYGEFPVIVGDNDEPIDTTGLAPGDYWLHAVPEDDAGNVAAMGQAVGFNVPPAGWNLAGASYMSKSFSVSSQDTSPQGIYLSPDGTRLYMVGGTTDDLHQYGLSTAWDISTASFVRTRDISANDNQATGVFFKSDGTRCYVVGNANNSIYEYTLSSAWDISTTTLNHTLSIGANQGTPQDVWFSADGLKMYTIGSGTDAIQEYDLGTAWTLSTATYSRQKVVAEDILPHGLHFKDDGSKVYWVGGTAPSKVYQYDLSTAWNITTAAYSSISFDLSTQITSGHSIRFGDSGTKFYVVDSTTATIYQYEAA